MRCKIRPSRLLFRALPPHILCYNHFDNIRQTVLRKGDLSIEHNEKKPNPFLVLLITLFTKHLTKTLVALAVVALVIAFACIVPTFLISSRTTQFGLRNIGELATQAGYYTNVQVIKNARELWGWQIPLTQSKYIFSYDGIIKAGLNFEEIDVAVDGSKKTVTVSLPEVKVLSNEIFTDGFEVYDESSSAFSPLKLEDLNQAMTVLKAEAEEKALGNGLLESARQNAELLITGLLTGQYGSEYTIVFAEGAK